jgi:hypothetical protein
LHSVSPGNCKRTLTGVPTGGALLELTNTPPVERLVPQPLKVRWSEVTPTITS